MGLFCMKFLSFAYFKFNLNVHTQIHVHSRDTIAPHAVSACKYSYTFICKNVSVGLRVMRSANAICKCLNIYRRYTKRRDVFVAASIYGSSGTFATFATFENRESVKLHRKQRDSSRPRSK